MKVRVFFEKDRKAETKDFEGDSFTQLESQWKEYSGENLKLLKATIFYCDEDCENCILLPIKKPQCYGTIC